MKYRLTEDWLDKYKKGDVFTYFKETWLTQNGLLKEDVTPIELSLLLKTGILEKVKEEEWPKEGQDYWFVDSCGDVAECTWSGDEWDELRRNYNNIFRTETEALEASEKIKTLLLSLKK